MIRELFTPRVFFVTILLFSVFFGAFEMWAGWNWQQRKKVLKTTATPLLCAILAVVCTIAVIVAAVTFQ